MSHLVGLETSRYIFQPPLPLPNVKSTLLVDPAGQKPNTINPDLVKYTTSGSEKLALTDLLEAIVPWRLKYVNHMSIIIGRNQITFWLQDGRQNGPLSIFQSVELHVPKTVRKSNKSCNPTQPSKFESNGLVMTHS